ncbi:hypothetical protein SAMN05421642_101219 [Rhodococcoides kyotonense]|uniref:Uridine kinase n=1 Tax=Rhodococcoides kyotonense TaxID=398843 RepID=A0A239CWC5_9NOCA|nr:hypothetical protein SAMN05421642_101219 [Rhodococcus kyotonensis]
MSAVQPMFPDRLARAIVDRVPRGRRAVVVIDGADAADPVEFATRIRDVVVSEGRSATVVDLHDFVRPASLRFEYSRTDELTYRTTWFDFDALDREVIAPLQPGGRGRILPRLWDEATDRSARARLLDAAPDHLVVVAGPMILGRIPSAAVVVHLLLAERTLRRRTPDDEQWTIEPLLEFYEDADARPDMVVRWDHPDRPAVIPS